MPLSRSPRSGSKERRVAALAVGIPGALALCYLGLFGNDPEIVRKHGPVVDVVAERRVNIEAQVKLESDTAPISRSQDPKTSPEPETSIDVPKKEKKTGIEPEPEDPEITRSLEKWIEELERYE